MINYLAIAVDSGKHTTKSVCSINGTLHKIQFRTKIQEIQNLGIDITANSYIIEFEGNTYLIGDMVAENKTSYDITKHSMEHLLCIYLAITKFIEKANTKNIGIPNIRLAVNVPLNIYKNAILKDDYEQFIQNQQRAISLRVNGRAFIFRIEKVILLPEGTGPIYTRIGDFKTKRSLIVDIGGLNVNYCSFNGLVPLLDTMVISNSGINILRSKIAEKLTSRYGISVSDEDVEQILKDGCYLYANGTKQEDSKEIIEGLITAHVTELLNYAKSRGLSFNNTTVVFCGGGSLLLKEEIIKQYPSAIIEQDGQFSNVLSFYKILEVKKLV
ncbi:ParM/StbA family protein [Bacillus sp. FSL W8-0116]|uniref:ParM/StbA family protein n=1 Tax=Bacillus sp. FSL W8-0116 TaxID=2978206 RepID=UPI0030F4C74B